MATKKFQAKQRAEQRLLLPFCIIITTSNKLEHFKEINSYLGMTMVKKEQGQDDYFSQQSIILKLQT